MVHDPANFLAAAANDNGNDNDSDAAPVAPAAAAGSALPSIATSEEASSANRSAAPSNEEVTATADADAACQSQKEKKIDVDVGNVDAAVTAPAEDAAIHPLVVGAGGDEFSRKEPVAPSKQEGTSEGVTTATEPSADVDAACATENENKNDVPKTDSPAMPPRPDHEAEDEASNSDSSVKIGDDEAQAAVHRHLEKMTMEGNGPADEKVTPGKSACCSCRRSACMLLYCPCYGAGRGCRVDCRCKNCRNPLGANPLSKRTERRGARKQREKEERRRAAREKEKWKAAGKAASTDEGKPPFPALLMLTVSPGRLGLTLAMVPEGGARIKHVDPACTFRGQLSVGDRIVTIDGKKIETLEDVQAGRERVRKFGIVKAAAPTPARKATGGDALADAGDKAEDPRKQVFTNLKRLDAYAADRQSEHRREDLLTELLQWDKKNGVNVRTVVGAFPLRGTCGTVGGLPTASRRGSRWLREVCMSRHFWQFVVTDTRCGF